VPTDEPEPELEIKAETETAVEEEEEDGSRPQVSRPVQAEPGLACLGSGGEGITCLTAAGEWATFNRDNSAIGGNYISAMAVCNKNTILIAHSSGISLYDGQAFSEIPEGGDFSSPDAAACDANGGIWVALFEGVSYYNSGSWTTYDSSYLGDESLVYDVRVTADNAVWILTSGTITRYANGEWTVFAPGSGLDDTYFFENLTLDQYGTLWASHSDGLLHLEDGVWFPYEKSDYNSPQGLAVDLDGRVWMGSLSAGISLFDGSVWKTVDTNSTDLGSNAVQALAVDGNGRVWAGTSYGLTVFDGDSWQTYRMNNAELGSNDVTAVAIIDGGPTLPEPMPKANGSLTGYLTLDGQPIGDTLVEICVESIYSYYSGGTPCADQPFFLQTRTDAQGIFRFDDVPVGSYVLIAETGDGFALLTDDFGIGSEMIPVFEGEETDIGEIFITTEE
jgi:streptogramin lyase